ncbi:MAG: BamA/TamA family outer membrane protein [Methylophilaceae bacterium]|nr:BamA/TamA family outer membrane protein [Methylophilaceae bacterium]
MVLSRLLAVFLLAGLSVGLAALAEDQPPAAPASPKFEIRGFNVEGNTLLSEAEIDALVRPFIGANRDFADVQRALEALQGAYRAKGYGSVQVLLPEQALEDGVIDLRVIEQRIAGITIDGNAHHDEANVMRALPSIAAGTIPNMKEVRRALKVANENPSKQTAILFKNNDADEAAIDATVKVIDDKPWKAFLTVDNSGSRETLHGRIGFGFQHYNLFNRDHRFTAQYITNTHFPDQYFNPHHRVNIIGLAYTIPFYEWGDSLDLVAGYSDVNSGTVAAGAISVTGKGVVMGARYNHNFDKIGNYDHKLTAAVDYHAYRNDVLNNGSGTGLTPHVSATPWSLTYSGVWRNEQRQFAFSLGASWNLLHDFLAAHAGHDIYAVSPYLAEDDFQKFHFSFDYTQPFAKTWQFHAALSGQMTNDHLIPGEQFRAGGMDSVRGWHESVLSGDKGYRYTIEFISPDFGTRIGENVSLRGLVFMDKAHVNNNGGIDGSAAAIGSEKSIGSLGFGLRYGYKKNVVGRFDFAWVQDGDITKDNPNGSRRQGDTFGHVGLAWIW